MKYKKDYDQITIAAKKLSMSLTAGSKEEQMQELKTLLQDRDYAYQIAAFIDSNYFAVPGESAPTITEEQLSQKKELKEEKIATNVAGFYALECGTNYFVTKKHIAPSEILHSLVNGTLPHDEELLFARFANATWRAGQPFRGLDRITRDTFKPFYFFNKQDVDKDLVQIKAAAAKLLTTLEQVTSL